MARKFEYLQILKGPKSLFHYILLLSDESEIDYNEYFIKVPELNLSRLESAVRIIFKDHPKFSIEQVEDDARSIIIKIPMGFEDIFEKMQNSFALNIPGSVIKESLG